MRSIVLGMTLVLFASGSPATTWAGSQDILFYISDLGINQWRSGMRLGDRFSDGTHAAAPDLPKSGQILVPMPSMARWKELSASPAGLARLRAEIESVVQTRVQDAIAKGQRTFEIQLIENINTSGYPTPWQQGAVNAFGAMAYGAIGSVVSELKRSGERVSAYAIVGSNGAKVLTESIEHTMIDGKSYLKGASLFDGRAHVTPTAALIKTIGAQNVRLFTTHGDWWAPFVGVRGIAALSTIQALKDRYPELRTYHLTPTSKVTAHISGIVAHDARFIVDEYRGNGEFERLEGTHVGRDLTPRFEREVFTPKIESDARKVSRSSTDPAGKLFLARSDLVGHFAEATFAWGTLMKDVHEAAVTQMREGKRPAFTGMKLNPGQQRFLEAGGLVKDAFDVYTAIENDRANLPPGPYALLRGETLEKSAKLAFGIAKFLKLDERAWKNAWLAAETKRLDATGELVTALLKTARERKVTADLVDSYLDATIEVVRTELELSKRITSRFAWWSVYQDFAVAGVYALEHRHVGHIDAVTRFWDAVNAAAWTGLGAAACAGHYACASAFQEMGRKLADLGRSSTEDWFSAHVTAPEIVKEWKKTQQEAIALGMAPRRISEVYGVELLRKSGFSDRRIQELDASVDRLRTTLPPAPARPVASAKGGPGGEGGVVLDVGDPSIKRTDMQRLRESVLDPAGASRGLYRDTPK